MHHYANQEGRAATKTESFRFAGLAKYAIVALIVTVCVASVATHGGLIKGTLHLDSQSRDPDARLSFFVVGDWGFGSDRHQPESAQLMNRMSGSLEPDFVISTGDNMYPDGMKGKDDPKFRERFTLMYDAEGLQVPWHAVLGNHDYGDGGQSDADFERCNGRTWEQCEALGCCPSPVWQATKNRQMHDRRWHCSNGTHKMTLLDGDLDIIFIDTTPYITRHHNTIWAHNIGGLLEQDTVAQTQQIESLLNASSSGPARWTVVVGHHAVRSYGHHCTGPSPSNVTDCQAMAWLAPLLQQHGVLLYLAGHDHDMQHIKFPNETTHFVTSGGGGDYRPGEFDGVDAQHAQFLADDLGFAAVEVEEEELSVALFTNRTGYKPAHVVRIPAAGATGEGGGMRLSAKGLARRNTML